MDSSLSLFIKQMRRLWKAYWCAYINITIYTWIFYKVSVFLGVSCLDHVCCLVRTNRKVIKQHAVIKSSENTT